MAAAAVVEFQRAQSLISTDRNASIDILHSIGKAMFKFFYKTLLFTLHGFFNASVLGRLRYHEPVLRCWLTVLCVRASQNIVSCLHRQHFWTLWPRSKVRIEHRTKTALFYFMCVFEHINRTFERASDTLKNCLGRQLATFWHTAQCEWTVSLHY